MSIFPISSLAPSAPPSFQRPKCLLTYSNDANHQQEFTNTAMNYFVNPPSLADLNYGYERWLRRPETRTRLDTLLNCLDRDEARQSLDTPSIVTWRGVITKILIAPYEERDSWVLNAMLVDGTIYLEEHLNESDLQKREDMTPEQKVFTYYGYSFESWCTTPNANQRPQNLPDHPPGWGGDVNTNVQWCQVVKTKLGRNRMLLGGEVDCIRGAYDGTTDKFVELKTTQSIRSKWDETKFQKKLLKFWAQSYLLGVPEIFVGFRSKDGILQSTKSFRTLDIPRMVRSKNSQLWDAGVCLNFAEAFFHHLRQTMKKSSLAPETVWRLTFIPRRGISLETVEDPEVLGEIRNDEDRVGFLPSEFFRTRSTAR